ncbi:hypothetical protein AMTRI_Chr09g34240 [Amborella trichopoda]
MVKRSLRDGERSKEVKQRQEEEEEEEEDEGERVEREEAEEEERKKRAATGVGGGVRRGMNLQVPCCQADKCEVDLRMAKRYHRRHKVCEAHAKASVVLVCGINQRFCQQCSRFHDLSQFDEAKRSCRSRLAGHNKRRRKTVSEAQAESKKMSKHAKENTCRHLDRQDTLQGSPNFKHFQIR